MKNSKKLTYISRAALMILTCVLIILFFGIMSLVSRIQGTARVVNYAGLVRGKTQRIIKLEDAGQPQDGMIADIDAFIEGLRYGSRELDLVRLNDTDFQNKMTDLADQFEELKKEIQKVREQGYEHTQIIEKSETFFNTCDEATGFAEKYSQKKATDLSHLENIVVADIVGLLLIIGWELVKALRYAAQNAALRKKVYLDEATGLPNKNKCEELLNVPEPVSENAPVAVCVFDLNNLRTINNNLGHDKGDEYIRSFAQQLRLAVPEEHFVGRDGGDEFLALLHGLNHEETNACLSQVRESIAKYSEKHPEMPISYAVGYALSTDFEGTTMRELFRLADKNMYVDKNRAKMEEAAEVQRQNYQLLDEIKGKGYQFTDCIYCDALLDEYRVLRASSTFFLAEDGSYSGAVEQIVQELSNHETRKELWKNLQLSNLKQNLSEQQRKIELAYHGAERAGDQEQHGRITILFVNETEDQKLHHFILGFDVYHDVNNGAANEKMQLTQYYDQMKQSILENGKYVDALLETAEAVYTVNLTDDKLEAAYFHGMDRSIEVEMEVPCSYNEYCEERSSCITEDTLENFRIVDTSEKLIGRFTDGDKQVVVEYQEKGKDDKLIWLQKTVLMTQNTWYDNQTQKAKSVIHGIILFKNTSAFHEKDQKEKERLKVAIEEANSVSQAKTDFLNRMSHDIRTPINGIMGMVDITRKYRNDPQKLEECLDKIQLSSRHLQELINDVLDMSKLESEQTVLEQIPFDLEKVMNEVSSLVDAQLIQNNITYRIHRENMQHMALIGSPLHLRQIMLNLISNAIKYNKPGGTINTYTKELTCDGTTAWFEFKIIDTGIGMSEKFVREELFKPFTQEQSGARTRYKGTGLGMSIVGRLVEMMGGTIEAASVKDEGTTICFRVPLQIDQKGQQVISEKTEVETELRLKGYHILLVEDNEINMEIAQFYLEENGAIVVQAWNGQEAVDQVKAADPGTFDAILMDIMMPVMDGMEAARQIRIWEKQYDMHTLIIAMTAQASLDSAQKCREAGMDDYVTKPVDQVMLVNRISHWRRS